MNAKPIIKKGAQELKQGEERQADEGDGQHAHVFACTGEYVCLPVDR